MQRRVKHTWRGVRVRFYRRVAGHWTFVRDADQAVRLWEQPGAIPVFTEYELPIDDRSRAH